LSSFDLIAKTLFGLEGVLAAELVELGAEQVEPGRRMVAFRGDVAMMYRANIHCRTAVRILKPICTFTAEDETGLYQGVGLVDWQEHLDADASLAVDPVVHSSIFTNSLYAAQLAKDAIVDQLRSSAGRRPSVDLANPDLRINLHIDQRRVTVYLDASGDSLHKRGYRAATGEAPLNEVLAAGILRLAGWGEGDHAALADFMCGSGTLVIEAAMLARRMAPGLVRKQFGYMRWKDFSDHRALHESLLEEARRKVLSETSCVLQGSDLDPRAMAAARQNAERAGVAGDITWLVANFDAVHAPAPSGLVVTNPPYDERMKTEQIGAVYRRIGDALRRNWPGYTAHVLTGNLAAAREFGLRSATRIKLFNGPIECRVLKFNITSGTPADERKGVARAAPAAAEFRNRLSRMAKHWHRWARRQGITCYRLYDRDIPQVPLAIDWYDGRVLVGLYKRRHERTDVEQRGWLEDMAGHVAAVLELPREAVVLKSGAVPSSTPKGADDVEVCEGDMRFWARLAGSSDTGLALDQRTLRAMVRREAAGKRFLNLFARGGAGSVAAALGGAIATTSVDASRAWIERARRNFELNRLAGDEHEFVCQDPLAFLRAIVPGRQQPFDLVLVEPPRFDGQRREGVWNVQDGHAELIDMLVERLSPSGKIYFVTTFRRLKIDPARVLHARIREITRQTVPADFRNKKIHRAWSIVRTCEREAGV
jgi:23S rRNA (guanine2445-N2)-methyltransferase / 23S rRNA (guanine2069-N7)-methyltransferase